MLNNSFVFVRAFRQFNSVLSTTIQNDYPQFGYKNSGFGYKQRIDFAEFWIDDKLFQRIVEIIMVKQNISAYPDVKDSYS
ncbi:MAG: hypothetical protein EOO96_21965 [Pedobacter sp.]|nr:MAG: hypothetical protein EOO96_21965 [Pedobacter sp.]